MSKNLVSDKEYIVRHLTRKKVVKLCLSVFDFPLPLSVSLSLSPSLPPFNSIL